MVAMAQQLVVIAFDDALKAHELLLAASRLQAHGELSVEDAVIITKDPDGRTHRVETTDLTPAEGALSGAFWGLLFGTLLLGPWGGLVTSAASAGGGALLGKLIDRGVSDDFIKQMRSEIEQLKQLVAELSLKNRVLKKSLLGKDTTWED